MGKVTRGLIVDRTANSIIDRVAKHESAREAWVSPSTGRSDLDAVMYAADQIVPDGPLGSNRDQAFESFSVPSAIAFGIEYTIELEIKELKETLEYGNVDPLTEDEENALRSLGRLDSEFAPKQLDNQANQTDYAFEDYDIPLTGSAERIRPFGQIRVKNDEQELAQSPLTRADHVAEGLAPTGDPINSWIPISHGSTTNGHQIWIRTDDGDFFNIIHQGNAAIEYRYTGSNPDVVLMQVHDLELSKSTIVVDNRSSSVDPLADDTRPVAPGTESASETYIVKPGDSLWQISQETDTPFQSLLDANLHLRNPDLIQPGDVVNLSRDTPEERFVDGDVWDATEGPPGTYGGYDPFSAIEFDSGGDPGGDFSSYDEIDPWDATEFPPETVDWYSEGIYLTNDSSDIVLHSSESDDAFDAFYGSLNSAYGLYNSIESGDALGIADNSLELAQAISEFSDIRFDTATTDGLSNMSGSVGVAGSAWSFYQAIDRGDALGATGAGLAMAQQGTMLYSSAAASSQAAASAAQAASGLGVAAGAVGVVASAIAGDFIGVVAGVMMMIPGMQMFGVALAIANALGVFGGDPEPYEAPTGDGHFTRTDDGDVAISSSGTYANQGDNLRASLSGRLGELEGFVSATPSGDELVRVALQQSLRELRADLPDDAAIIPERLPSLSFNGYFYIAEFSDPDTAHSREIAIAPADVVDMLVDIAHYCEAVVPQWEADTAAALQEAGDPQYWYTEEQHAFVESDANSAAGFMPIALDLSSDEVISADALALFDVDDDSYRELTQWIAPQDGVLALDRAFDGRIDTASELFSNPALAAAYRGLGGLAWLDVNQDGVIDSTDPVFNALRVWQDSNADGISDPDELSTLADIGISALDYTGDPLEELSPAGYADDGSIILMASAGLAAESQGVRIEHREDGMLVEEENGETLFYFNDPVDLGPNEEKSRNVPGNPQTVTIDRSDVQRGLRAAGDAATRATPFGEAGVGLLAFGIGFGNSQATTLEPGESGSRSASEDLGVIGEGGNTSGLLAEPVSEMNFGSVAPDTPASSNLPFGLIVTGSEASGGGDADSTSSGSADIAASVPRASFGLFQDPLAQSSQSSMPAFETNSTPLEGPSTSGRPSQDIALNGGPLAADDVLTIPEDAVALITQDALLANDADFSDLPILAVTSVGNAQHGTVILESNGTIRFTPEHNFYGVASFEYVITDGRGRTDVGVAKVNVTPVNDIPLVGNEAVTAIEDIPTVFVGAAAVHPLLQNDSDVEGDLLSITAVSNATHGAVSLASDSTVTFVPDANYFGAAQFDYTVSDGHGGEATATAFVDVEPVNDAPVITGTESVGAVGGTVFASDIDNPADELRFSIVQNPLHGVASIDAVTGVWSYASTPCNPFHGIDPFVVEVADPDGASDSTTIDTAWHFGSTCDSGKKPLIVDIGGDGLQIVGVDDSTVFFDVNDDGWREKIAWAGPEDGLLTYDKDADGLITDHDEISFVSYLDGARTDLEGLRGFDTNEDGLLSPLDHEWDAFGVWQDRNQDGITDVGELSSLDDRDIAHIALDGERRHEHLEDGSVLFGTTHYVRDDGSTGLVGDVRLAYDAEDVVPAGDGLSELVDLPRSAAEQLDREEAVAAPEHGYQATELEREVAQLRADMAVFEAAAEETAIMHAQLLELTVDSAELDEPKDMVT